MEIRIDERLVEVFNEVVEKDATLFDGKTDIEKATNSILGKYLCFIFSKKENLLSQKSMDNLFDFVVVDEGMTNDNSTNEEEIAIKLLLKLLVKNAGK